MNKESAAQSAASQPEGDFIVSLARAAARKLAEDCASNPEVELDRWLKLAYEREVMASEMYDPDSIDDRMKRIFARSANPRTVQVIRDAIRAIWKYESEHVTRIKTIRRLFNGEKRRTDWLKLWASVQGVIARDYAAESKIRGFAARVALAVAAAIPHVRDKVPSYMPILRQLTFGKFCRVNIALEQTAIDSYERMIVLEATCRKLRNDSLFTFGFGEEVELIRREETAHRDIFEAISGWITTDSRVLTSLSTEDAFQTIRQKGQQALAAPIKVVERETKYAKRRARESRVLLSDAGLGDFYAKYGAPAEVLMHGEAVKVLHRLRR